jgi:phytoene desaturase
MTAPLRHPLPHDDGKPRAIVIGAGFGGIAMAIRLQMMGYQVDLFEKNEQAGGRANVFREEGFTFDGGPTIITAPHLLEELFTLCGKTMQDECPLVPMQPFYQIRFFDGSVMNCSGDTDAMRAEVKRLSPGDLDGYDRFMRWSERTFDIGFQKLGNQPFNTPWDMAKAVPEIISLGGLRSIFGQASRFVQDERLRIALSFHPLFIGGNPLKASAVYGLVSHLEKTWGVHFALGGTGAMVGALVRLLTEAGGRIHYLAEVSGITAEAGRATGVRLATGETFPADIVACNADAAWAYENLLPAEARRPVMRARLKHAALSCGIFIWYFGARRRYDDVAHHTIVLGPRYEGLLKDIFSLRQLADDFSLYLYRPTATDQSLAPAGCDSFYVLAPVPHLAADVDWLTHAEPYRLAVQRRLEETVLPGLGEALGPSKVMTPIDFRDRFHAPMGAAFGMEPILTQSAYFRPQNKSHWLKNLFMVGASSHPGAGIPGVLTSARIAAAMVPAPEPRR